MAKNIVLLLFVLAPLLMFVATRAFFVILLPKLKPWSVAAIISGNLLIILFLFSELLLMGEVYYRFFTIKRIRLRFAGRQNAGSTGTSRGTRPAIETQSTTADSSIPADAVFLSLEIPLPPVMVSWMWKTVSRIASAPKCPNWRFMPWLIAVGIRPLNGK